MGAMTTSTENLFRYRQIIRPPVTWLANRGESFGRQSRRGYITMGIQIAPSFGFTVVLHIHQESVSE